MRTLRLPLLFIVLGVAAIAFLVYQFFIPRDTVIVPAEGGTYVEGVVGTPKNINPLLCQLNEADRDLCSLVFSGLTRLNESGEAVPDLAETWGISDDGITYTFTLRQDAKWEDGTPVTSSDVVFTTGLMQDPAFPGRKDIGDLWKSVTVTPLDARTVTFALKQPYAPFIDYTSIGLLPSHILSGTVAANLANIPFNQQPKGSGPWRVAELNTSGGRVASIGLEPSGAYAGPKPQLGRLVLRYYPNSSALLEAFRNGDVDGMANLLPEDVSRAAQLANATVYSMPQSRYVSLLFNERKDSGALALTELPVRQALMNALDRDAIIRDVLKGQAVPANTPFIPGTWAHDTSITGVGRDLERAKQLLQNAGYELTTVAPSNVEVWQKNGEPIAFTLLTPESGIYPKVADAVARQWRELGVQVTVVPVRNIVKNFLANKQFQVALTETLLDGDPDPFSLWHASQAAAGQNYSGWENTDVSQWLDEARKTVNREQRFEFYRRFQQKFAEELPALMLYYPTYEYVVSSRVRNVQVAPIVYPSDRFRSINDWTINTRRVLANEATPQP
jgi:peptide/nickel transport system substrate-binding protein